MTASPVDSTELSDAPRALSRGPVVPLSSEGERTPLFFVHGAGGTIYQFALIAPLFNSDQPVYGVEAVGLWGEEPPHSTILEMAQRYVDEIRRIRPEGPYLLAGFSMGGAISMEMARLFRAAGQQVAIAMLDAPRSGRSSPTPTWWERRVYEWQTIKFHLYTFWKQPARRKRGYLREPFRTRVRRLARLLNNDWLYRWALNLGRTPPPGFQQFRGTSVDVWTDFEVPVLDVPITVFRAHVQPPQEAWDLGWSTFTTDTFAVVHVPGYHPYMFVPPHGQKLVEALTEWVSQIERRFL
jgi:thioesterase domain-containing protein